MGPVDVDEVDRGILYLLQQDARNYTTTTIGDRVGVSSSTVGNRINKLEDADVITGYHPTIDYEKVGLDAHLLISGTVPFQDLDDAADRAIDASGVVSVRELLADHRNLSIEVVADSLTDVEETLAELKEAGIRIDAIRLLRRDRVRSFDGFGEQFTEDAE